MAQNQQKHYVPFYAKKKMVSIFNTKEVTAEEQKL